MKTELIEEWKKTGTELAKAKLEAELRRSIPDIEENLARKIKKKADNFIDTLLREGIPDFLKYIKERNRSYRNDAEVLKDFERIALKSEGFKSICLVLDPKESEKEKSRLEKETDKQKEAPDYKEKDEILKNSGFYSRFENLTGKEIPKDYSLRVDVVLNKFAELKSKLKEPDLTLFLSYLNDTDTKLEHVLYSKQTGKATSAAAMRKAIQRLREKIRLINFFF